MATSAGAFEQRERAAEQVWIKQEERTLMIKRLEKLVEQGRLDKSVLESVRAATAPDPHHSMVVEGKPGQYREVPGEISGRSARDFVYDHKPGTPPQEASDSPAWALLPKPTETESMRLGMPHVDLGPGRWASTHGEGSIFSWREMERLGEATPQAMRAEDAAKLARRAARAAAMEAEMQPTLFGRKIRMAGTAALVAASARGMGVKPGSRTAAPQPAPDV